MTWRSRKPGTALAILGASLFCAPLACGSGAARSEALNEAPYKDASRPVEERVADLLGRMTLEEKIAMLSGNGLLPGGDGFASKPNARLGIPELRMTDGPVGVRWEKSTAFPSSINMAATWDPEIVERIGRALARETKARGRNVLLGPCVNIHRVPEGGRNFESFGEDPFLAARLAVAYICGVQSESVVATVKHFACNNQETDRGHIDVKVSERALHEIYFPAFRAAVEEAGVWSVMSAYNKVNGAWCSENPFLLTDILKRLWGFRGFVMSDWGAVHSAVPTVNAGLDLEMPDGKFLDDGLLEEVRTGRAKAEMIDDAVRRMLRTMMITGIFDGRVKADAGAVNTPEHRALVREAGAASIVLLKNQRGLLPISPDRVRRIAVIGPHAELARFGGGGSSRVTPLQTVSPLEALRRRCGDRVEIVHEVGSPMEADLPAIPAANLRAPGDGNEWGLRGEYFANVNLEGEPVFTRVDPMIDFDWGVGSPDARLPGDGFSIRWTGRLQVDVSGVYDLCIGADDGIRFILDGEKILDHWSDHSYEAKTTSVRLEKGRSYDVRIEYYENRGNAAARFGWRAPRERTDLAAAVAAARGADLVLVFTGLTDRIESEGFDRESLNLPPGQDELIEAVAGVNPNTVVVLQSGAPVLMNRWLSRVGGLLQAWYPGEECGNAIVDVLFGDVNPSGRLPLTFPRHAEDAVGRDNFPGDHVAVQYDEGLFVGYRHFDARKIEPLFPFGFGLSYTTFAYRNLVVRPVDGKRFDVSLEVGNTGGRAGAEVVQLYVTPRQPTVERPEKELKAFRRVVLAPGEWKQVSFSLGPESFAHWDPESGNWRVAADTYRILVGASSREIKLEGDAAIR